MSSEELKPCPFCNGEGVIYEYSTVETCPCSMRPAQPAEAEGPIQCPASHPAECYAPGTHVVHASLVHGIVRQADALSAALSAVTAERDQLRAEVEALRAQANALHQVGHALGLPAGSDLTREVQPAIEALRKDAERYRWLRARWVRIADEYDGDSDQLAAIREADSHFEGWDVDPLSLDRAIDAAMAAKEGV